MCGIFGGFPGALVENASALLHHRGPDQYGVEEFVDSQGRPFLLAGKRLNIIDHRDVPVPMEDSGAWISFNGEVYNWRDLRHELEACGHVFRTDTDTEVVLKSFLKWGPDCLARFNGMFAIVIWCRGELFMARDRLGQKPLFYSQGRRGFAFASEIKVFCDLEYAPVDICERLEFYFDEYTPFSEIYSVRPGEYVVWHSQDEKLEKQKWWKFPEYDGSLSDLESALSEFLPLFNDACRIREAADCPVTIFLSGGIDSSLIQSNLGFEDTFTIQFDEFVGTIDEDILVEEFAGFKNFRANILRPQVDQFLQDFSRLAYHIEMPVGSFSIFPLHVMSEAARAGGFKVALSGEGADELFNGYYRNEMLMEEDASAEQHLAGAYAHLARKYFGSARDRMARMASRHGAEDWETLGELFADHWVDGAPFAHNMACVESSLFLQPLLAMADRMSMANSLEVRNPFLDYRIIEFSVRLSPSLRFYDGQGKFVLREALKRSLGTDKLGIVKRKEKHGLPAPINNWFFNANNFDRANWNNLLLGECMKQLRLAHA